MYDLIYTDSAAELQAVFPQARIEAASDGIHRSRYTVEVAMDEVAYWQALLDAGPATVSLHFTVSLHEKYAVLAPIVRAWLAAHGVEA